MKIIPYSTQWIDESDIGSVNECLNDEYLTQGPRVAKFEHEVAEYCGAKYAVAVNSGTSALHAACYSAGIMAGDEAITSPVTFVASANCVLYCGGKPVFVDVQEKTANIDPLEINTKISEKTKAIIPVHYAGQPCDLPEIYRIAQDRNLIVIEDAAHALGAEYRGEKIGCCSFSDMTILSFHPVKHITTGEGGMVLTNRKDLYDKLIMFRSHGITKRNVSDDFQGEWYYEMQFLGYNYRMTDIQASLGISQLKKLNRFINRRKEIANIYKKVFKDNPYFDLPMEKDCVSHAWHLFPVRLKDEYVDAKIEIFSRLRKLGLWVQVHYMPIYFHPFYRELGYGKSSCIRAEDFYRREISLPIYPAMTDENIEHVVQIIIEVFKSIEGGKIF